MKCFNCNKEMIYRDDIRGLEHAYMPYGANTNSASDNLKLIILSR